MTGLKSRRKGQRTEREVVNVLQHHGIGAERVPLSGAAGGKYKDDISMPLLGRDVTLEVKHRANGFKQVYDWLSDAYGLVLRADRKQPLICLRLEDFAELAKLSDEDRLRNLAYGICEVRGRRGQVAEKAPVSEAGIVSSAVENVEPAWEHISNPAARVLASIVKDAAE